METKEQKKLIDKIRKMVQKAESAKEIGSIKEAEVFAQKVQELLTKYNLSKSDITLEQAEEEVKGEEVGAKVKNMKGVSVGYKVMYQIAKHNWCYAYTYNTGVKNPTIMLVGSPENVEVCKYIYSVVLGVFERQAAKSYNENKSKVLTSRLIYIREFIEGAAIGLGQKLKAEKEKMMSKNKNSNSLMIINDQAIVNYVNKHWGGASKGRRNSYQRSNFARENGIEFGRKVNINKGVTTKAKPIARKMLG